MIVEEGVVLGSRPAGTADCTLLSLRSPRVAARVRPGQFVMARLLRRDFPYLGRPLSVADVDPADPEVLLLVFTAVGAGTRRLAEASPGDAVRLVGPLGNGFTIAPAAEHVLIAGGIGVAPFPLLARYIARLDPGAQRVCLLGAATRTGLHLAARLRALGVVVETATLDGSEGFRGNVVERLAAHGLHPGSRLYACGPDAMLAALARHLGPTSDTCQAALEAHMACGFGACNACVITVADPGESGGHHELACLQGPVFALGRVRWERTPPVCVAARPSGGP